MNAPKEHSVKFDDIYYHFQHRNLISTLFLNYDFGENILINKVEITSKKWSGMAISIALNSKYCWCRCMRNFILTEWVLFELISLLYLVKGWDRK